MTISAESASSAVPSCRGAHLRLVDVDGAAGVATAETSNTDSSSVSDRSVPGIDRHVKVDHRGPSRADARTVSNSFDRMLPRSDWIAKYFYAHLFTNHPEVRPMFPKDMNIQRDRFFFAIVKIVGDLANGKIRTEYLSGLGAAHASELGVIPAHYPAVGDSLIATLKKFHGLQWSAEIEESWRSAYQTIADVMLGIA